MRRVIRLMLGVSVFAVAFGLPTQASAQAFSVGYQYQQFNAPDGGGEDASFPLGMNFDVAIPVIGRISAIGQIDWGRDDETFSGIDTTITTVGFGGGLRADVPLTVVTPFVQGLFGGLRINTVVDRTNCSNCVETQKMFQLGGGVVVPMGRIGVLAQGDYRKLLESDDNEAVSGFRFVAGVRLGVR